MQSNKLVDRIKELLASDQLRGKETSPRTHGLPSVSSAEKTFETQEEELGRQRGLETVWKKVQKLPANWRSIALARMGDGKTPQETRQQIEVSGVGFHRKTQKVRQKLKKLEPIWGRFGKARQVFGAWCELGGTPGLTGAKRISEQQSVLTFHARWCSMSQLGVELCGFRAWARQLCSPVAWSMYGD